MRETERYFRYLCRKLLAEGVKPTPTEFAKRGFPYVDVQNDREYSTRKPRVACANPGSGTTWTNGRYAQARREVLREAGWTFLPGPGRFPDISGRWVPPTE